MRITLVAASQSRLEKLMKQSVQMGHTVNPI